MTEEKNIPPEETSQQQAENKSAADMANVANVLLQTNLKIDKA